MAGYDEKLQPLIKRIPASIKPNHLVLLRVLLILPLALALLYGSWLVAAAFFIIASALDILDGSLARLRGQISASGAALDPIADKLLFITTIVLIGFNLLPANLFIAIIIVEIVTVLGAAATSGVWYLVLRKEPRVDANRYGKYKTTCYFIATLLLFLSPWSLLIFMASLCIYYLGLLLAILSIVRYNLDLAKNN